MAYTIVKSDGTVLTTIADGTINTTSTSIGLPGRNYAGYGQTVDTNFVHQLENFAATTPPANPLRGQLWYNTNNNTLYVCPTDGETNSANWMALTATSSGSSTTFGNATITGNTTTTNLTVNNNANVSNTLTAMHLVVNADASIGNATLSGTTSVANLNTSVITAGSDTSTGTLTGVWTVSGSSGSEKADAVVFTKGGISISNSGGANLFGIKCDKYMYANGVAINFSGTYSNANVGSYLPVANVDVKSTKVTTPLLTTGSSGTAGTITGTWTLSAGSNLQATYADLAERFESDKVYAPGTVVEIGGTAEITAVKVDLSENVFGVISNTAAYLMNAGAGPDETHPPVALAGRVNVNVIGVVHKGDRLVSAGNGLARAANPGEVTAFNTIGRALKDKLSDGQGTVEAVVMIR